MLSTPATHILSETSDANSAVQNEALSEAQLETRYELARTIVEIKENRWRRIALQFPDEMLPHSARVYQRLARGLQNPATKPEAAIHSKDSDVPTEAVKDGNPAIESLSVNDNEAPIKLTILADTSYGSCCVDEIAAEHVDADVIVHYGRACLSPTARLPVIHVYTRRELDHSRAVETFRSAFPDLATKVVVTADVLFSDHVQPLCSQLAKIGYRSVFPASIVHDPSSPIPNRTLPPSVLEDPTSLRDWHLFHISDPATSLLLTLKSRMASIIVHPTSIINVSSSSTASTSLLLRRRYALITSLATTPIWGILINTLSVRHYLSMITHVQNLISSAGRKSYLFVVGKINAAKIANFAEIGGWVVIGCWESSLIDSKEFYRPIITPFELEMALKGDERVWTGEWRADFAGLLDGKQESEAIHMGDTIGEDDAGSDAADIASDEESEPPEFDLRTGRYISRPKPGRKLNGTHNDPTTNSTALTKRAKGAMISVNAIASPAADFLAKQRTWRGLGSDFEVRYEDDEEEVEGAMIEEGQTGVAGGYAVGEAQKS